MAAAKEGRRAWRERETRFFFPSFFAFQSGENEGEYMNNNNNNIRTKRTRGTMNIHSLVGKEREREKRERVREKRESERKEREVGVERENQKKMQKKTLSFHSSLQRKSRQTKREKKRLSSTQRWRTQTPPRRPSSPVCSPRSRVAAAPAEATTTTPWGAAGAIRRATRTGAVAAGARRRRRRSSSWRRRRPRLLLRPRSSARARLVRDASE